MGIRLGASTRKVPVELDEGRSAVPEELYLVKVQ
jgi:hypothetical protein